jgi:hypothetical protein
MERDGVVHSLTVYLGLAPGSQNKKKREITCAMSAKKKVDFIPSGRT